MYVILVAIIVGALVSFFLLRYADSCNRFFVIFMGFALAIGSGVAAVAYAFTVWGWMASEYQANVINREYGTQYTREEVFYASKVIDTIRELDRNRYEINGNVARECKM